MARAQNLREREVSRGTVREAHSAMLGVGPQGALEGSEMTRFPLKVWRTDRIVP